MNFSSNAGRGDQTPTDFEYRASESHLVARSQDDHPIGLVLNRRSLATGKPTCPQDVPSWCRRAYRDWQANRHPMFIATVTAGQSQH